MSEPFESPLDGPPSPSSDEPSLSSFSRSQHTACHGTRQQYILYYLRWGAQRPSLPMVHRLSYGTVPNKDAVEPDQETGACSD